MMRLALLLLAPIALAAPALADEPATAPVVILRGSSAPPTPWYEPPPEPKVVIQPVYVPLYYYLPAASGPFIHRHPHTPSAKRNR